MIVGMTMPLLSRCLLACQRHWPHSPAVPQQDDPIRLRGRRPPKHDAPSHWRWWRRGVLGSRSLDAGQPWQRDSVAYTRQRWPALLVFL